MAVWRSPGNHWTRGGYNHSRGWLFTNWAQEVMFSPLLVEMFLLCFIVLFHPNSVIKTFRTNLPLLKQRRGDLYQLVDVQRLNSQWLEWGILEDCSDAWKVSARKVTAMKIVRPLYSETLLRKPFQVLYNCMWWVGTWISGHRIMCLVYHPAHKFA